MTKAQKFLIEQGWHPQHPQLGGSTWEAVAELLEKYQQQKPSTLSKTERNLVCSLALDIVLQATRHQRACSDVEYLIRDLEIIEEKADAIFKLAFDHSEQTEAQTEAQEQKPFKPF